MTTSSDLLCNAPRTYGGSGLWDSRRLMELREGRPLNTVIPDDQEDVEPQVSVQSFFDDTQVWQYIFEAGYPAFRAATGMLVPNEGVDFCMTDVALQIKGRSFWTTNTADLVTYQAAASPVPTTTQPLEKAKLVRRLITLYSLPEHERWPDSDWPTVEAFNDALKFIALLPTDITKNPHISFANDGEVNFGWKSDGLHIDLGFYGTGTYSYYARGSDGSECFGDDVPVSPPFPEDLSTLLSS